jgi:CBS domain-containing protein
MTREVVTVDPSTPMSEVRRILTDEDFHHLPVVSGTTPFGMVSSHDLLRLMKKQEILSGEDRDEAIDRATTLEQTMKTDLVTMRHDDTVERAIDLLADGERHSVLVVDADEALVGIVTNIDVLEYLFD